MRLSILNALAASLSLSIHAPALADTLVDNVQGITIDENGEVKRFTGLVFDDEGRITDVLERADERPQTDFGVDGGGQVMLPGMIDGHVDVMAVGFAALTLDLTDTASLEEAQAKIAQYAKDNAGRTWILGRGWNRHKWGLDRFPTAAELDAAVSELPVWLESSDGTAHWANSAAMARASVTASSRPANGGRMIRDAAGNPSGVFVGKAKGLITEVVPRPRPADRDAALAKAQQVFLTKGITSVTDMGTRIEDWQTYRRAGDWGRLNIRIMSYADDIETMELIGGPGQTPWLYNDKLRLLGVQFRLDGPLGAREAALKEPYSDAPDANGALRLTPAQLRNRMSRAALDNFQTAVHAVGDAANAEALLAIEELAQTYTGDRRWRIEQTQIVAPDDVAKFGKHAIIASMQPLQQTANRTLAEKQLGQSRLSRAYRWRSVLKAGGVLAFGSAAPIEPLDPFAAMAAAISRVDAMGEPFGGWYPNETVSREAALKALTADAAFAGFGEGRFGRLIVGERADFLIVDRDPLFASPQALRTMQIKEVWVGGKRVVQHEQARITKSSR